MGCCVLNLLYRLDISLVEIFFIYKLKLGTGGRLFMSAHNPNLQFVIGLHDFPKTKAKGVVLAKSPWYETSGSLEASFQHEPIPSVSKFVLARKQLILCYVGYVLAYLYFLDIIQISAGEVGS